MKVIDVYEQYFKADCMYNTVQRNGAVVKLTATSDAGMIKYEVTVSFFPHRDDEDFGISYDACNSITIYEDKGRRSKKREQEYLPEVRSYADEIAAKLGGTIDWDSPLIEARLG